VPGDRKRKLDVFDMLLADTPPPLQGPAEKHHSESARVMQVARPALQGKGLHDMENGSSVPPADAKFVVDQKCKYWSTSHMKWVPAKVLHVMNEPEPGVVVLNTKPGTWLDQGDPRIKVKDDGSEDPPPGFKGPYDYMVFQQNWEMAGMTSELWRHGGTKWFFAGPDPSKAEDLRDLFYEIQ
jgi:hypothetical protein